MEHSRLRAHRVLAVFILATIVWMPAPATAHTGFESSSPSDGDTVDEAVGEIVIRFTAPATPAGDGFTVFDPSGEIRQPTTLTTDDDTVFILGFDPPLVGGDVGVRWMVRAGDAHPIDGAFSFEVLSPTPMTTASTTVAAMTTTTPTPAAATAIDQTESSTTMPTTTAVATEQPTTEPEEVASSAARSSGVAPATLEEFLSADGDAAGQGRQLVGRIISFIGALLAVGVSAFLVLTFRGSRRESTIVLRAIAVVGAIAAVGAVVEYSGWIAESAGTVLGETTSAPGVAMMLRLLGGLVVAGAGLVAGRRLGGAARVPAHPLPLSAAVATDDAPSDGVEGGGWSGRPAPVLALGAALLIASFSFDGHTVSEGPRVVHAVVNAAHVLAAAVWVGGVLALLGVASMRRSHRRPSGAAELVVRFSSVATVALGAVLVTGALMAIFVLDTPGDLTGSEWGRTFLLKSAVVGVIALIGAHNHFRLRPRLRATPDDERLQMELRRSLGVEGVLMIGVIVVTAWLVAAAT